MKGEDFNPGVMLYDAGDIMLAIDAYLEAKAVEVQCIREGNGHNQTLIDATAVIRSKE